MTDREMLEWAAKATGWDCIIEMYGHDDFGNPLINGNNPPTIWNPLIDDGDALRVAVALNFQVHVRGGATLVTWKNAHTGVSEPWGDDKNEATRRAIVGAAAVMAHAMEEAK
jgi:hypothetical protein